MTFLLFETIRCGNSTAKVKNFYPANNLLVIYDVQGEFQTGSTVVADDSGTTATLSNFVINDDYDLYYDDYDWIQYVPDMILSEGAHFIFTDEGETLPANAANNQLDYAIVNNG